MFSYTDKINDFIKKLDHTSLAELDACATTKIVKKGDSLLKQDQICRYSFLIEQGVVRKYYLNDGKEITTELFFENDLAISFESYYTGHLSETAATQPLYILIFALIYFVLSCFFSHFWAKKLKNGSLEMAMRKISG